MRAKVQRWGNSLGVRVPKAFADEVGVSDGSEVEISAVEGALFIRPLKAARYSLGDLLQGVTTENLHGEVSTGSPTGREAW